ncbi:MAG: GntR family transcriptional regulator [Desulfitobacteriaceae bacterium]
MNIDRESKTPLYEQIYNLLKQDIQGGNYKNSELLPSERELCIMFGVERITVRKALENLASDGLVVKVAGLGTRVNALPKFDCENSICDTILFILPKSKKSVDRITEPFNAKLFYSIEKEARLKDYNILYRTAGMNENLSTVLGTSVAGIFFVSDVNEKLLLEAHEFNIPAVVINNSSNYFTSILSDGEAGAFEATNYLIELGHKKIAAIQGVADYITSRHRLEGYQKALLSADIQIEPELIKEGEWTYDGGYAAMKELLKSKNNLPTAVFAFNDVTAFGAIAAMNDSEFSVPEEISVVGFDNIEQCEYVRPRLTTVSADINLIAKVAMNNLLTVIVEKNNFNLNISIPTKLIIRESTAPNKKK